MRGRRAYEGAAKFWLPRTADFERSPARNWNSSISQLQNKPQIEFMKQLLTLALAVMFTGASYAGCGIKIDVSGEAKAYDAEKKTLTVGTQAITLAATAKITDAAGKEVSAKDLVGKQVTVSTDKHNKKGESVTEKKS